MGENETTDYLLAHVLMYYLLRSFCKLATYTFRSRKIILSCNDIYFSLIFKFN